MTIEPHPDKLETKTEYRDAKLEPVHPKVFADRLKERILQLQPRFIFGENMMRAFEYYGSTYNEVLHQNIKSYDAQRYVLPASTGSGKSVGAKLYLAIVCGEQNYSGLLAVGKVRSAIEAVIEINQMAGRKIAATTYTISSDNPDCEERVKPIELENYPVIVISHQMMIHKSRTLINIEKFKIFKSSLRQIIIIDEHIDFSYQVEFRKSELVDLNSTVKDFPDWNRVTKHLDFIIKMTNMLGDLDYIKNPTLPNDFHWGIQQIKDGKGRVTTVFNRKDQLADLKIRNEIIELLDRVAYIIGSEYGQAIVKKQGSEFFISRNEDLTNRFGSCAILDATANALPLYRYHQNNRNDITRFQMPEGVRNYQNTTLHIHHNKLFKQSNSALVKLSTSDEKTKIIDYYLDILYSLTEKDRKSILVCTFKGLIELFRTRNKSDLITFIHWGIHEGTNEYSNFSKACAIGWFRKSIKKYVQDIDSIQEHMEDYISETDSIIKDAELSIAGGLAADFVQFFNRTRSRVAIDPQGNCEKTDFYMFIDGNKDYPIDIIENEMPGINIEEWTPQAPETYPIFKRTADEVKAERIIKWLNSQKGCTIGQKAIIKHFEGTATRITKSQVSKILKTKRFELLLEEYGITKRKVKTHGNPIFFDIPEEYTPPLNIEVENSKRLKQVFSL